MRARWGPRCPEAPNTKAGLKLGRRDSPGQGEEVICFHGHIKFEIYYNMILKNIAFRHKKYSII